MKSVLKIGLALTVFTLLSLGVEAKSSPENATHYTIRKDSLSIQNPSDTTKKAILFPNPFNFILIGEGKK